MKLKLLTPLLLTLTTLFFIANANANAETLNTNIPGLVIKELRCGSFSSYYGRWVNRNNQSLGNKRIKIHMYDSDGDRTGVQSTYIIDMGAKTGGQFFTSTDDSPCRPSYSITFFVE